MIVNSFGAIAVWRLLIPKPAVTKLCSELGWTLLRRWLPLVWRLPFYQQHADSCSICWSALTVRSFPVDCSLISSCPVYVQLSIVKLHVNFVQNLFSCWLWPFCFPICCLLMALPRFMSSVNEGSISLVPGSGRATEIWNRTKPRTCHVEFLSICLCLGKKTVVLWLFSSLYVRLHCWRTFSRFLRRCEVKTGLGISRLVIYNVFSLQSPIPPIFLRTAFMCCVDLYLIPSAVKQGWKQVYLTCDSTSSG